ncbi:MAG: hypothetical protein ACKVPJ_13055 [Chitinophagales bacterium]
MRKILLPFFQFICVCFFLFSVTELSAQGCVAIRSVSGVGSSSSALIDKRDIQIGLNYRGFHSYKHFRGPHEETNRVDEGSDVRNDVNGFDLLFTYGISKQLSATIDIPYTFNWRSSKYEHANDPTTGEDVRRSTSSQGINDIRLQFDYWLFNTHKAESNGNMSLGLGIKLPTGNFAYQDTFYYIGDEGASILKEVDQSIQPGDGGWGISFQSQGFAELESDHWFTYYSIYYLFTPQDTLSWEKRVDKIDPANPPAVNFSISDQYLVRAGFSYLPSSAPKLATSLGIRAEGIPVEDFFGETNGRRRPGYAISLDPGLSYTNGSHSVSLNIPFAVHRNRTQSVADIERQQTDPGEEEPRHGDAAFSDYTVFFSYAFRIFNKKTHGDMDHNEYVPTNNN